jgi:hypothetical protein
MPETNPWTSCAQQLSELGLLGRRTGPTSDLLVEALRVLLWLCSEQAPVPHSVEASPRGTVQFRWHQAGAVVEVEVIGPGRCTWRATPVGEPALAGGRLDREAARVIRSLIPLSRTPARWAAPEPIRPEADGPVTASPPPRAKEPRRKKPRG